MFEVEGRVGGKGFEGQHENEVKNQRTAITADWGHEVLHVQ